MKTNLFLFLRKNWIGSISGIAYCIAAFLVFFAGLAYAASCPESGHELCNANIESTNFLLPITIAPMVVWGAIFYSTQQASSLLGVTPAEYSSSFFIIALVSGVSVILTLFAWAVIGSSIQTLARRIKQ